MSTLPLFGNSQLPKNPQCNMFLNYPHHGRISLCTKELHMLNHLLLLFYPFDFCLSLQLNLTPSSELNWSQRNIYINGNYYPEIPEGSFMIPGDKTDSSLSSFPHNGRAFIHFSSVDLSKKGVQNNNNKKI